jgi:acylglycerol lipase
MRSFLPLLFAILLLAGGCAPTVTGLGPPVIDPQLAEDHILTADGVKLPLRKWLPEGAPRAVFVALHGFNDYSNGFKSAAEYWATRGFGTYAYDQRGFGETETRWLWPGDAALTEDLRTASRLVRNRYPGIPIYAVGVSMGGSVILVALGSDNPPDIDGAILSAAGVTGGGGVTSFERAGLWLAAHTIPWATVTGEGARTHPSDNREMLRALVRDPVIMKKARIDAVYGMIQLADRAQEAAPNIRTPMLILYGWREDIVRRKSRIALLEALPPDGPWRLAEYPKGYHLLLRDLNAQAVLQDIAAWALDPAGPLPSGQGRPDRWLSPPPGGEKIK